MIKMNVSKEMYDEMYANCFESYKWLFSLLNGDVEIYPVVNTLQVRDYSKYRMSGFDEDDKKLHRREKFPADLENAFKVAAEFSKE